MTSTVRSLKDSLGTNHWRQLLMALLSLAIAYFAWRSIPRALSASMDLTVGYTAAHAILQGFDPYDATILSQQLLDHGAVELGQGRVMDFYRNLYFPATLPLFLPLTLVSWPTAKLLWLVANLLGVAFSCWGLLRYTETRLTSTWGIAFIAFSVALAPIHTAIAMGQTSVLALAALVGAMLLERAGYRRCAGVAYGISAAIKVQISLPFIAYLVWRRRWPTAVAAMAVLVTLTLMALAMMPDTWYATWQMNLAVTTTNGGHNDPTLANAGRHSMIGLQVLLHNLVDSRSLANWIAYMAVLGGALYAMYHIRDRYPDRRRELLALSVVGLLGLLVTYHRTYDAVVLLLPLALALPGGDRRATVPAILMGCFFILPLQTMLYLYFAPRVPEELFWTVHLGATVQVVVLVAGTAALLYIASRKEKCGCRSICSCV